MAHLSQIGAALSSLMFSHRIPSVRLTFLLSASLHLIKKNHWLEGIRVKNHHGRWREAYLRSWHTVPRAQPLLEDRPVHLEANLLGNTTKFNSIKQTKTVGHARALLILANNF